MPQWNLTCVSPGYLGSTTLSVGSEAESQFPLARLPCNQPAFPRPSTYPSSGITVL